MVKRKAKKNVCNNDVPNWVVLVLLVAVIVVSTVSIILFMDAAETAEPEIMGEASGEIVLSIVEPPEEVDPQTAESSGEIEINIVEPPVEETE